jgi:hypothetical protein
MNAAWLVYARNHWTPGGWHLVGYPVEWKRALPIATRKGAETGEMVKMINAGTGATIYVMPDGMQVAA